MISNILCQTVDLSLYDFDYLLCANIATTFDKIDFGVANPEPILALNHNTRNLQTPELLERLESALVPCRHGKWLEARGCPVDDFCGIDFDLLSEQDLFDLFLYPGDHILDRYGYRVIDGPAFCDYRDGRLVGIGVRNVSTDLEWVAVAKFTFSNYGLFLFGFDDYLATDEIYVVEGVFDAVALRSAGFNAVAIGSALPSPFQLACLARKFSNIKLCLDNDFHGWCGAMTAHLLMGWPIFSIVNKDAGCGAVELFEFDMDDLAGKIKNGVKAYNQAVASNSLSRKLPYNSISV